MDKETQHFESEEMRDGEKRGPRHPDEAGTRNTDQQAQEQRAKKGSAQFTDMQEDDSNKKRQ